MTVITKDTFDEFKSEGIAIIDFWAPWCGPCKMLEPNMIKAEENAPSGVKFGKVNVDDEHDLSIEMKIRSIPSVMIFKNGELVDSFVGLKSSDAIVDLLTKII